MPKNAILLVDDKPYIIDLLTEICESINRNYYTANDGEEAFVLFQEHQEDVSLIICDMVMPRMTGKDLFFKIKDLSPEIQTILISGYPVTDDLAEFIESGQVIFLKKPFEISELLKLIAEN
jgi:CheY-like chemotaxis protein